MEKPGIDPQHYRKGKAKGEPRTGFHSILYGTVSTPCSRTRGFACEVKQLIGHSSDAMKQQYNYLELERLREVVSVIPNL